MYPIFFHDLSKGERLALFKKIKAVLIAWDAFTVENVRGALEQKLKDLDFTLPDGAWME